jgi:alpha-tubulin suppressor-like RCC1 family protein
MAGMTRRAESAGGAERGSAACPRARWELGGVHRLRPVALAFVLVASVLLASAVLSASASARVPGGARPAAGEDKPPKVDKTPKNATVEAGQSATFESGASGTPTPTVQWEVSTDGGSTWSPIEGATADTLTIADTSTSESGNKYRATFTNSLGSATSEAATLTVRIAPAVTEQPMSTTVEEGQNAVFEATASGFPAPTVQWEVSTDGGGTWAGVPHGTEDELTVADTRTSENGYEYRATFTNPAGHATTEAATLTVHRRPMITKQPVSAAVEAGESATFEASASGFPTPTVQWEESSDGGVSWNPVAGATADLLTVADTKTSENGYEYRAAFTNAAGSATSEAATLGVHTLPAVTEQPAGITVEVGQSATFEAAASGFPAPTVQWEVSSDGGSTWSPVAGATEDQLTIAEAQTSESGDEYRAVFTNAGGKAISEAATLTVAVHHYRAVDWGQNSLGQLGDGNFNQSDVPVPVSGLNFVTAVAAGEHHSLVLLSNGTVMAWGANTSGQLGVGEAEIGDSDIPVAVEGLTGVTAIAAGGNHSLALLSNGTVMAWGENESGELGDGNTNESDRPVPVTGLTEVIAIAAGREYSLALRSGGTVVAWGAGERGQLGNDRTINSDTPVNVKDLTGVTAIAAGGEHALALLSDGTVMAWGENEYGQLGNRTVTEENRKKEEEEGEREVENISDVPVPVEGLSSVTAITAGANHSLALLGGGTVMAWGEDKYGQLGDGSIARDDEAPAPVSGLSGVAAVSAGGEHSLALLAGGTLMAWGENRYGELGDGSAGEPSDVPVAVTGLGEVAGIEAGGYHDLVYSEPIPSVSSVSPDTGAEAGGATVTITGANFEGVTAVRFGASSATRFTVHSPTSITAVSPVGALGTVNITVSDPAGTSPPVPADRFTYLVPPTVIKLSAKKGPGAGGTTLTITGTNFTEATAVRFGSAKAKSFTVHSSSSILAESPAGAGTVEVTVTTPGGTSASAKHDVFEYTPAVESVTPDRGSKAGGESVTITGSGFALGTAATAFKFGSKQATEVNCTSNTTCTLTAPAAKKAGAVTVTATVGKLKSPSNPGDQFTYE